MMKLLIKITIIFICSFLLIENTYCQVINKQKKEIEFANKKKKVLTLNIKNSDRENKEYLCKEWKITKNKILNIINLSKPISMHDFMYLYYVLPCEADGVLLIGNKKYNYVINGGSYIKLYTADTTYYYGCSAPECQKYFLQSGGDPKRDLAE